MNNQEFTKTVTGNRSSTILEGNLLHRVGLWELDVTLEFHGQIFNTVQGGSKSALSVK